MTLARTVPVTALHPATEQNKPQPNAKLHDAAVEFESLLIAGMLRSARQSGGGWMSGGEDQSAESLLDTAEQQFARILAAGGGLGMAKLITQGLAQTTNPDHPDTHPPADFKSSAIRSAYSGGI